MFQPHSEREDAEAKQLPPSSSTQRTHIPLTTPMTCPFIQNCFPRSFNGPMTTAVGSHVNNNSYNFHDA